MVYHIRNFEIREMWMLGCTVVMCELVNEFLTCNRSFASFLNTSHYKKQKYINIPSLKHHCPFTPCSSDANFGLLWIAKDLANPTLH